MAGKADGSFLIDTGLNTSGVKAGAKEIKETMKEAASSVSDMGKSAEQTTTNILGIKEAVEALEKAEQDLKALSKQGQTLGDFEYDEAFIGRADALKRIKEYQADLTKTPEQAQAEQERAAAAAEAARIKQQALAEKEAAAAEKAAAAEQEANTLKWIGENAEISNEKIAKLVYRLQELKDQQAILKEAGLGLGYKEFDANEKEIAQVTAKLNSYRQSLTSTGNETKKLDSHTRKSNSAFSGFGEKLKSAGASMKKGITTLLKYAIGIRTLFALFNKLRAAIKQGLGNLAQYDSETNASLSALKSSLTQLKNSLATAFAPILQSVVPILVTLINYLIQAANAVAMFMAAITGKGKMAKAVAVQEEYAAAVGGTGAAAKEAKKYLSGLDEIQTFTSDNGGGGGGGGGGVDPSSMFEIVEVQTTSFMDDLIDLIKNGDWHGVGEAIAEKLNTAISEVDWESIGTEIGEKIDNALQVVGGFLSTFDFTSAGMALGTAISATFDRLDWKNIGQIIFNGLKGAISFADGLILGIKWKNFGVNIANAVNEIKVDEIYNALQKTIGDALKGVLDFLAGFLESLDWAQIGRTVVPYLIGAIFPVAGIIMALKNIDVSGIVSSLSEVIGALVGGLVRGVVSAAEEIWEGIQEAWASIVEWWQEVAFEDGEFTIEGLLNGIWEGIKDIGQWIKDNIFDPFIEGFKAAFGISSPSTVMEEQGVFIMEGLMNGISGLVSSVVEIFNGIKDKITTAWDTIKSTASTKWATIKSTLTTTWNTIKSTASTTWTNIKTTASTAWDTVKTDATTKWNTIKSTLSTTWNTIKSTASTAWTNVKTSVSNQFTGLKTNLTNTVNGLKTTLSNAWNNIKTTATNVFNGLKTTVVNIWNGMKNAISGVINGISGVVSGLTSGIRSSINSVIGRLNGISIRVPTWVPFYGGRYFGFSIPYLASGAVIPPNAPFTAVLGDQRHGTNIETPESLLRQVIREEAGTATYQFVAQINRKTLFDQMIEEAKMRQIMTGRDPFALAKG